MNYNVTVLFSFFLFGVSLTVPGQKERSKIQAQHAIHLKGRLLPDDQHMRHKPSAE